MINYNRIKIKHLTFLSQYKAPITINFSSPFTLILGASDTGKSYLLETIDYMLGASTLPRSIDESSGYEKILLGLEVLESHSFTLLRSMQGGHFQLFENLHQNIPKDFNGKILTQKTPSKKNPITISNYLLEQIYLNNKKILKNKTELNTINFSFRNISVLTIIDEEDILKKNSPISSGITTNYTVDYSTFKLLLTGKDDSSIITLPEVAYSNSYLKTALDKGIQQVDSEQLKNNNEIEEINLEIEKYDKEMGLLIIERTDLRMALEELHEKDIESQQLIERFNLLDQHYSSDIKRLESTEETGSVLYWLPEQRCAYCGAEPSTQDSHQHSKHELELLIKSAFAEKDKIISLREELLKTIYNINHEKRLNQEKISNYQERLENFNEKINNYSIIINNKRASYKSLLIKERNFISHIIDNYKTLVYTQSAASIEQDDSTIEDYNTIPPILLEDFCLEIENILVAWNFPNKGRVVFDSQQRDITINGKERKSFGKGKRALTRAAFIIALMQFCLKNNLPHPGFVIIDSPLLSYKHPENSDDDLSNTDVAEKFYEYLTKLTLGQVIIIENKEPSSSIKDSSSTIYFSNSKNGLFPIED